MTTRAAREKRLVAALSATLLALVAAIAATLVTERRAAGVRPPPVVATPGAVSRIAIERPGREDIVLERLPGGGDEGVSAGADGGDAIDRMGVNGDSGDWRIVAPCAIDANDARVAPLLDALAGARLDYAATDVDLAGAGLVEPLAVVRLDDTVIALGGTDLGGERRYARSGERVALVPEWTLSLVDGGLSALAESAPFRSPPTRLRRLDGAPDAPAPDTAAAEPDAAGTALDPLPWGGLSASQVVTWPMPDAPPTTRSARLEATLASGATRVLELVGNASWNALSSEDGACAWLFADADLPPDAYR